MTGLFTQAHGSQPHVVAAEMAEQSAVHLVRTPNNLRVWVISRDNDARAALLDRRLGNDSATLTEITKRQYLEHGHTAPASALFGRHMLFSDGDDHARLRRLVLDSFLKRTTGLRPRIELSIARLLDQLGADAGPVDLVADLAAPLSMSILGALIGIPERDRAAVLGWADLLIGNNPEDTASGSQAMAHYATALIEAKRTRPAEDLLSDLLITDADGDQLTDEELMGTVGLLVVAGHEATINLIGNFVAALLDHPPTLWRALGEHPGLLSSTVEELLRLEGPMRHAAPRFTREPLTIGDTTIPEGEIVLISLAGANRDRTRYPDATRLRPGRVAVHAPPHLSFGFGPHYCMGAELGRMEVEATLSALTRRFPAARLAVPAERLPRTTHSLIMLGHQTLPVYLRP